MADETQRVPDVQIDDVSDWLTRVQEEILDPERPIVDPHHHLWHHPGLPVYEVDQLWIDTQNGHNIEKTVFMECGTDYREDGPEELRSLGEVEFVLADAKKMCEEIVKALVGLIGVDGAGHEDEVGIMVAFALHQTGVEGGDFGFVGG